MKQTESTLFQTAIYIRLSQEDGDKEESDSIGNQRKLLTEYLDKKADLLLYDFYVDDGYTGTSFCRPDFQRLMEDIEAGKVNCVLVKDLSRFGRDYIETGRYLERYFPDKGVRFISVSDGIDSMKQAYDLLLPIKNIFNEQYARDISSKIQATVKSKQEAGEFIGSFASYGYRKSTHNKNKLLIDEYPASVVRRIFSLYIKGYGKQKIAKLLNEEGVLCPTEYKKAVGLNYHNPNKPDGTAYWSYSTINSILHREMYAGNMVQGTKRQRMRGKQQTLEKEKWIVVKDTHEAVIDRKTWEKAQELLGKRTREPEKETTRNLFAGLVVCGTCGRAMVKNTWRRADGTQMCSLYCGTYKRYGKECCTPHTIPVNVLEQIVLGDLKAIIQCAGNLKEIVKAQSFPAPQRQKMNGQELRRLGAKLERIRKLNKSVYEDYKENLISKEEFLSYREDYLMKENLYVRQIEALEEMKEENAADVILQTPWLKRFVEQRDIEKPDREILVEMIQEIKVYEHHKIKISYNFSDELQYLFSGVYCTENDKTDQDSSRLCQAAKEAVAQSASGTWRERSGSGISGKAGEGRYPSDGAGNRRNSKEQGN